jgi:selenocysteine lyase/cysteine desulfurase
MNKLSRREVLAGLTSGAFLVSGESFAWSKGVDSEVRSAGNSEYLFEPGLNYLNTAALGPTPRTVLDRVLKAWYELELNPVMMAYGDGTVHVATDHAREQVAALVGCTADELLITRMVSPSPGPLATALVSFKLPASVDSRAFRDALLKKYGIVIKIAEKRWFNGIRISPHIFNTEKDIDAAIRAIRTELA